MTDESKKRRRFDPCTIPSSFAGLPELPDHSIADLHQAGLNTLLTKCDFSPPLRLSPWGREKDKGQEVKTPVGVFFFDPPTKKETPKRGLIVELFFIRERLRGCHRPPLAPMLFTVTSSAAFPRYFISVPAPVRYLPAGPSAPS